MLARMKESVMWQYDKQQSADDTADEDDDENAWNYINEYSSHCDDVTSLLKLPLFGAIRRPS